MSTFAALASPTSGLQGYDLEGADGKGKKRTFFRYGGKITVDAEKCDEDEVKKGAPVMAAGFALVTNEGKALFLKRSDQGDHSGEWCFPAARSSPAKMPSRPRSARPYNKANLDAGCIKELENSTGNYRKRFYEGAYIDEVSNALWGYDLIAPSSSN
jgi:hypothetical protein